MGIDFKVLNDFKAIKQEIGMPGRHFKVATFGYQDLLLSIDQARMLFGEESLERTRVSPYRRSKKFGLFHIPFRKYLEEGDKIFPRSLSDVLNNNDFHGSQQLWFELFRSFSLLGSHCQAFDIYPYNGVETIMDLTKPIPEAYHDYFDVVIDGGTTEHCLAPHMVFRNVIKMVRLNGVVMHILPLNYRGHGYYNFDPDLLYEYYGQNGFKVLSCSYSSRYGFVHVRHRAGRECMPPYPECIWFYAQKVKEERNTPRQYDYFPQAYTWGPLFEEESLKESTLPDESLFEEASDSMYAAIMRNLKGLYSKEDWDAIRGDVAYKQDPYLLQELYEKRLLEKTDEQMRVVARGMERKPVFLVVADADTYAKWREAFSQCIILDRFDVKPINDDVQLSEFGIPSFFNIASANPETTIVLFSNRKHVGSLWRQLQAMHPYGHKVNLITCWR